MSDDCGSGAIQAIDEDSLTREERMIKVRAISSAEDLVTRSDHLRGHMESGLDNSTLCMLLTLDVGSSLNSLLSTRTRSRVTSSEQPWHSASPRRPHTTDPQ